MKVAFHFLVDHPELGQGHGGAITERFLGIVLHDPAVILHSKVFLGDLLLTRLGYRSEGAIEVFDRSRFLESFNRWAFPESGVWSRMTLDTLEKCLNASVYTVCVESTDRESAETLHQRLLDAPYYLGAMEIDDTSGVHWTLYLYGLIPAYRVMRRSINVFWDSFDPESKLPSRFEMAARCGFQPVDWESLNGRFTVFDVYHNQEHARQTAVWKRRGGELLGFIADDVVSRLGDTAPEVGERLYSALKALDTAENAEDLAHVMASCRRVFEYVTDALFPPVPGGKSEAGRDIGAQNYRNRLLAFADRQQRGGTNIDLIIGGTKAWAEQLEKLGDLVNKGVHAKVLRSEARRCFVKTIMLLDDVAGLRSGPFEFQGHFER